MNQTKNLIKVIKKYLCIKSYKFKIFLLIIKLTIEYFLIISATKILLINLVSFVWKTLGRILKKLIDILNNEKIINDAFNLVTQRTNTIITGQQIKYYYFVQYSVSWQKF